MHQPQSVKLACSEKSLLNRRALWRFFEVMGAFPSCKSPPAHLLPDKSSFFRVRDRVPRAETEGSGEASCSTAARRSARLPHAGEVSGSLTADEVEERAEAAMQDFESGTEDRQKNDLTCPDLLKSA